MAKKEIFFKSKDLYNKYNSNKNWNGFNVLQTYSGRVGGLDLEFYSSEKKDAKSLTERIYAGAFEVLYLFLQVLREDLLQLLRLL